MKQFIVLTSMIMLGVYIFGLIAGPGEDSMYGMSETLWRYQIAESQVSP